MSIVNDDSVEQAVLAVRERVGDFEPDVMICLGSGLSEAAHLLEIHGELSYADVTGMVNPGVEGHPGKMVFGVWGGRKVVVFQGRLHWYEGHSWTRITLPVQLSARLGVDVCVFANSCGAVNPRVPVGGFVIIADHMNFMGTNPLVGVTANHPGERSQGDAYSPRLLRLLAESGQLNGIPLTEGVYAAVTGPNYETPAEVRALRLLGADVVGMSTVGEVLVARRLGLECAAISCVTNMASGVAPHTLTHHEVVETARANAHRLSTLLDTVMYNL